MKAQQEKDCRSEKYCHYESTGWEVEKNRERYEHRRCEIIHYGEEWNSAGTCETVFGSNSILGKNEYLFRTVGLVTSVRIMKVVDENGIDITPDRETFVKNGSRRCPHPRKGDSESDDIQQFGVISNLELTAKEILTLKRDHWKCESTHYILDVTFREDYNPAKAAKFNASLLRKVAYNICRLALFHGMVKNQNSSPIEAREIAETADCMRTFLYDHLPMICLN